MPLQQLQFRPGINRESTTLANEGGWFECNKVRFRSGYPEKIGGWTPLTNQTFLGICRSIWNWVTLKGNNLLGIGTNEKFYIENGGVFYDITPYRLFVNSGSINNPYRITNNSSTVTVVIANHSTIAGDLVTFANSSTVGTVPGAFFDGTFSVNSVINANAFTITIDATPVETGTLGTNPLTTLTGTANVTVVDIAHGMIANNVVTLNGVVGATGTLGSNPFASTSGSRIVTVTSTSHGLSNTFTVTFTGATTFGGIPAVDLNTTHSISNVTANTYTIITNTAASSTTTGGGAAVAYTYPYIGGIAISEFNNVARTIVSVTNANAYVITVVSNATANVSGGGANVAYAYSNIAGGGNVTYDFYEFQQRLVDPFSTTSGSSIVTVTDTNHGASDGAYVTFADATAVAGLTINGEYQLTYIDSNTYTIDAGSNANATTTGGGVVIAEYQINPGLEIFTTTVGWGSGTWGGFSFNATVDYLNGGINAAVTTITVDSTIGFPATGIIMIDTELITYTGLTATTFTGCTRAADGTTAASHSNNATVYDAVAFNGWGEDASNAQGSQLRLWSQANYGEYLIFNPRNEGLYLWVPEYSATNQLINFSSGELLSQYNTGIYQTDEFCPVVSTLTMVSDSSRFVISFGCNDITSTVQNPLLVRWSDIENYQVWREDATTQAGSQQLSSGSFIVTAVQTKQEILVFTDASVWSMRYIGPPFVWGFDIMSHNISILGPNVVAAANNIVYWMGVDKFYVYTGRVETLPSSLRQYVYNDINLDQAYQFFSGSNEGYNEIWWFYCSANSTTVDRYVIYNYLDKVWYYGTLNRTAWLDSPLRQYPMAASYANSLLYHENGVDDVELSGQILPIEAYVQSSDFDIGDGHNFGFVWRMIPDITFDGSTTPEPNKPEVTFTVRPRQNPGSAYGTGATPTVESAQSYANQKAYTVQEFTEIVYTRVRGRQMAFKVSSNTVGTQWQLGVPRIDVRPDGRR